MSSPKISVVIITYGHESYIIDTLKSVLNQRYEGEIELIISNDNSPDNTDFVIKEFFENEIISSNFTIKYTNHSVNKGMLNNFIWALKEAKGNYIAICEGDDYWTDSLKLQKQIDFLEQNVDFVLSVHNAFVKYEDIAKESHLFNQITKATVLSPEQIINNWIIPTASMVFRKEIIDELPLWVMDIYSGDFTLALLCLNKGKLYFMNEVMSVYRVSYSGASASSLYKDKMSFIYNEHIKLLNYFNEYSGNKFEETIERKVSELKKEVEFKKKFLQSKFLCFCIFPKLFIKKSFSKILSKVKNT